MARHSAIILVRTWWKLVEYCHLYPLRSFSSQTVGMSFLAIARKRLNLQMYFITCLSKSDIRRSTFSHIAMSLFFNFTVKLSGFHSFCNCPKRLYLEVSFLASIYKSTSNIEAVELQSNRRCHKSLYSRSNIKKFRCFALTLKPCAWESYFSIDSP